MILLTTNDETLSIQATKNKKNQNIISGTARTNINKVWKNIKYLSIISNLAKLKNSNLPKVNLTKNNFSEIDVTSL